MTPLEDNTALELPVRVILAEFVILFDAYVKDSADMNFGPFPFCLSSDHAPWTGPSSQDP